MTHTFYVVVLVVRPAGDSHELLLVRRGPGRYMGETWQLVSGGLDPGEAAWRGAIREVREETGLSPVEFYRLSTMTSFYRADNDSINTAPMFCAIVAPGADVVINDESTAFAWVDVGEAPARLMWPGDRQALAEVQAVILGGGPAKPFLKVAF
jgi:8-oxo-dGTP pyrophosphatase MutT (NUDIX family)